MYLPTSVFDMLIFATLILYRLNIFYRYVLVIGLGHSLWPLKVISRLFCNWQSYYFATECIWYDIKSLDYLLAFYDHINVIKHGHIRSSIILNFLPAGTESNKSLPPVKNQASLQSDQAFYCWLTNIIFSPSYP